MNLLHADSEVPAPIIGRAHFKEGDITDVKHHTLHFSNDTLKSILTKYNMKKAYMKITKMFWKIQKCVRFLYKF
jgi:hypothetical protein